MFKLVIQDDEGKTTVVPLIRDEITIGRKEGNTIRLTERNVSRRHARILRNNGEVHIEDLGSYNGIRVNNARIAERVSLRVSDQVQIGDYKLYLKAEGAEQADDARTMPIERPGSQPPTEAMSAVAPPIGSIGPIGPMPPALHPVHPAPAVPQMVGNPNRTLVAIGDADPAARAIGPATAAAVAALTATGGYGKLVVLSSNFAGKEFELSRPQMIIGRTDENDIVINHRSISRNHAKLVREPDTGRYTISDLQSSNGVRVNGQDYGKVELRRGDVIDLGHVRLRFVEAGEDFVFARDAVVTDVPEAGGRRGLVVALIAAIIVVVAGIVIYATTRSPSKDDVVAPGVGTNSEAAIDAGEVAVVSPPHTVPDVVVDAAPAATAGKSDDEKSKKIARCTELQAAQDWQGLIDCAKALDTLGAKDKAKDFQAKATKEQANDLAAKDVKTALRDHNLKQAETLLAKIGDGSVYYKSLHDQFLKDEAGVAEDARRRAQGFANQHDCAGLRRFVAQQTSSSTERVATAVQAVKCVEKTQPEPNVGKPPVGPGSAGSGSGSATQTAVTPPRNTACDTMNVEDLMSQATNQFNAGYAKSALSVMVKALGCKQDVRMYRLAATYACTAHDLTNARFYFAKVPKEYQPALEQKCLQEGLNLHGP
jgi:pSer/pThr/pTyr-binding forkhead associated (FHA) protein